MTDKSINNISMRGEDISRAIFHPNGNQDKDYLVEDSDNGYTANFELVDADDKDVIAKDITLKGVRKCYIKTNNRGNFLNPSDMYEEFRHDKVVDGRAAWAFRQVPLRAYEMYLKFLETKNGSWLRNAERESI